MSLDDPPCSEENQLSTDADPNAADASTHQWFDVVWREWPIALGVGLALLLPADWMPWFGYWLVSVSLVRSLMDGVAWVPWVGWLIIVGQRQLSLAQPELIATALWLSYAGTVHWWGDRLPRLRVAGVLVVAAAWSLR